MNASWVSRPLFQIGLPVCMAAAVSAQVTLELTAGTAVAGAGSLRQSSSWPQPLSAESWNFGGQAPYICQARALARAGVSGQTVSASAWATSAGLCGPPPFSVGMSADSAANARVRLSSSAPIAGTLSAQLYGVPAANADIGDDRTGEALDNGPVPIVIAPSGIDLSVWAWAGATFPFPSTSHSSAGMTFDASPTRLTTSGQPCEADLSAWSSKYRDGAVTLALRGWTGATGAVGFFVLGVTPHSVPIPPLGCVLATDMLIAVPSSINAQGRARLDVLLRPPVPTGTILVQFLAGKIEASGEVWRTSNRITVQIQ